MNFFINGEPADIQLTTEKTIADVISSFSQEMEKGLMISSLEIDGTYYASDNTELEQLRVETVTTIHIEIATQEEVSISLLQESKVMLQKVAEDLRQNGFAHAREFGDIFNWIMDTITTINQVSVFPLAEAKLVISTIKQVWEYLNSPERDEAKMDNLASIISNLMLYLDSIQVKISSHFEIGKKDLIEMIETGETVLPQIAEAFQLGRDQEALTMVHTVINVIENCSLFLKRVLPSMAESKRDDIQDLYNELNSLLGEMVEAFENGDFVLIGDLMEYELPDKLRNYKEQVLF